MKLTHISPLARKIARAAYPEYRGRKFRLEIHDRPMSCRSYWDGGSRDYFVAVRLDTMATFPFGTSHPVFEAMKYGDTVDYITIPAGMVIVEHSIFCGKDVGITFHVSSQDAQGDGGTIPLLSA